MDKYLNKDVLIGLKILGQCFCMTIDGFYGFHMMKLWWCMRINPSIVYAEAL